MTPESFAENFHILAEAPNGIQKLREMILQLAVRGKLVPQDPNDERASVLLKRIQAEKEKLVKAGKIRKPKPLLEISVEEKPFEIPEGWEWCRLADMGVIFNGNSISAQMKSDVYAHVDSGLPYITTKDVGYGRDQLIYESRIKIPVDEPKFKIAHADAVLICSEGGSAGKKIGMTDRDICFGNKLYANETFNGVVPRFIFYFYQSLVFSSQFGKLMKGIIGGISKTNFESIIAPLPPTSEQHRIVVKADQLIAQCDELETRQKKRAEACEALNIACLNALTSPNEDSSENAWQRISDNFNLLYECPENISALHQTILQLAVQGKLVSQNSEDEPASVLLKKIRTEKEKLIKEGKIKKQKPLPPINLNEVPYDLPKGWEWVRLGKISTKIHYGYTASAIPIVRDVRFLRITDIQDDHVKWSEVPGCQMDEAKFKGYELSGGDILIARTGGTIGKSYLVTDLSVRAVFASYLIRVILTSNTFSQYIKLFLGSELYWTQLYDKSMGTGQPNVNATALKSLCVPLPPLAEQKRIVAKVNQLMVLCHELEAKLKQSQSTAETLMRAVVNELTVA